MNVAVVNGQQIPTHRVLHLSLHLSVHLSLLKYCHRLPLMLKIDIMFLSFGLFCSRMAVALKDCAMHSVTDELNRLVLFVSGDVWVARVFTGRTWELAENPVRVWDVQHINGCKHNLGVWPMGCSLWGRQVVLLYYMLHLGCSVR
jgi:hypothetical protein